MGHLKVGEMLDGMTDCMTEIEDAAESLFFRILGGDLYFRLDRGEDDVRKGFYLLPVLYVGSTKLPKRWVGDEAVFEDFCKAVHPFSLIQTKIERKIDEN